MGTNMHRIKYSNVVEKTYSPKYLLTLLGIFLIVLFAQVEYMLYISHNASKINYMADQSNNLKLQNQQLIDSIAKLQGLDRVSSIAQDKYNMQPIQKVIYLNSSSTLSYNGPQ